MSTSKFPMQIVPVIETERLIMRAQKIEDFSCFLGMWADPKVTQFVGNKPLTEETAWVKFVRNPGLWEYLGYGYWAVEEKSSGRYIGLIGFGDFKRDMEPSIKGLPEIGWVLASSAHGKGYATEAVKAALAWSDKKLADKETVCIISPDNTASIRLAEKCGYKESAKATYHGETTLIFRRQRP